MTALIAWSLFALAALAFLGIVFSAGSLLGRAAGFLFSRD